VRDGRHAWDTFESSRNVLRFGGGRCDASPDLVLVVLASLAIHLPQQISVLRAGHTIVTILTSRWRPFGLFGFLCAVRSSFKSSPLVHIVESRRPVDWALPDFRCRARHLKASSDRDRYREGQHRESGPKRRQERRTIGRIRHWQARRRNREPAVRLSVLVLMHASGLSHFLHHFTNPPLSADTIGRPYGYADTHSLGKKCILTSRASGVRSKVPRRISTGLGARHRRGGGRLNQPAVGVVAPTGRHEEFTLS